MLILGMGSSTLLTTTRIKMKKATVLNKLTNRQAVQDIKDNLNSVFPNSDGEAIALEIAKHVFDIFYDDIDNAVSASRHDIETLLAFSFYLSRDSEFKFTQTYLRWKTETFFQCIDEARNSFRDMMVHFNRMIKYMGTDLKPYRLVYNELFSFRFDKGIGRWMPIIIYGNLSKLMTSSKKVFQVYKDTSHNPSALIYTSRYTRTTKVDRENLKAIFK